MNICRRLYVDLPMVMPDGTIPTHWWDPAMVHVDIEQWARLNALSLRPDEATLFLPTYHPIYAISST